jgi:hypothetical protein
MEFWRSFHFHEGEFPSKLVGPLVTEDGIGILLWILKWYYLLTIPSLIVILLNLVFRRQSVLEKIFMDGRSLILGSLFGPLGLAFNSEAVTATRRYVFLEKKYLRAKPYGYRLTRTEQDALWLQARHELLSFEQALERARHEVVVKPVFACALVWCVSTTGTLTLATLARQALTVVNHLAVACAAEVSSSQDKPHERNGGAPDFMPQALPSAFEFSCFTNVDSVKWFFVWDSAHIRHLIFHESNMARGPPTAVSRSLSHPTSPDCIAEGRSV